MSQPSIYQIYRRLLVNYGPQDWWPGDTPFEVMVGAVLTQNTSWTNVERAITRLKAEKALSAHKLLAISHKQLAAWLKPVGYFNVKARRLKNFCHWYTNRGGHRRLLHLQTNILRQELLEINGIGPETADDILLYAFERPVFVIDAYTRRLFQRLGFIGDDLAYEAIREWFERRLKRHKNKLQIFNEYHALIVHHAKHICKTRPQCGQCCLNKMCKAVSE